MSDKLTDCTYCNDCASCGHSECRHSKRLGEHCVGGYNGDCKCQKFEAGPDQEEPQEPLFRSWAPEVIADSSGKWCGNALRFATEEEALGNVQDLASRWMLVRETRAVQSTDPVTHRWDIERGTIVRLDPETREPEGTPHVPPRSVQL